MPAREDVNIKVSANVAEAIRMWQEMQRGPEAMAGELDKLGRTGKRAAKGMAAEFESLVGRWASVRAGVEAVRQAIEFAIAAQKEFLELQGGATAPVDTALRRFLVQTDAPLSAGEGIRQRVLDTARQRRVQPTTAFESATQLASSGFDRQEVVEGGALDEFLKLLNATNATGENVDSTQLTKAMVQFLTATKQGLTSDAIRDNAVTIQGLFRGTNLQTGNLARFAPEAAKIRDVTGLGREQLPLFSQFLDVTDEATGATVFRSAAVSLATAGATPKKAAGLKLLGLTPEDVDFQGESFFDVQERLAQGFASVEQRIANIAAKQIFGQDALLARSVLFSEEGIRTTQERLAIGGDVAGFEKAVGITEGGLEAKRRGSESQKSGAFFDAGFVDPETARNVLLSKLKEEGAGPLEIGIKAKLFDLALSTGADAAGGVTAATTAFSGLGLQPSSFDEGNRAFVGEVVNEARATPLQVKVELTDQDGVAVPHKSEVNELSNSLLIGD